MDPENNPRRLMDITFDGSMNVVTRHEELAISAGLPDAVRKYLIERMISHRMDCAIAPDQTRLDSIRGRILELQSLLDLFKV